MSERILQVLWEPVQNHPSGVVACLVPEWNGMYSVACDGTVWSTYNRGRRRCDGNWRKLRYRNSRSGHLTVSLAFNSASKTTWVHHLVLEAFILHRPSLDYECRHLDGHPTNNNWWNLQWGTRAENVEDMRRHGTLRIGSSCSGSVMEEQDVIAARKAYNEGMSFADIARATRFNWQTIRSAVLGITWANVSYQPCALRITRQDSVFMDSIHAMIRDGASTGTIMSTLKASRSCVDNARRYSKQRKRQ